MPPAAPAPAPTVIDSSFVVFTATVAATGVLPVEGLAILFGGYRFVSIAVATTNVIGNSIATIVTAKICGEFDPVQSQKALAQLDVDELQVP